MSGRQIRVDVTLVILILTFVAILGVAGAWLNRPRRSPVVHNCDDLEAVATATRPTSKCTWPPCEFEENWVCGYHAVAASADAAWEQAAVEHVGKHRAPWGGTLDDQPTQVIVQAVTDVPYRGRS